MVTGKGGKARWKRIGMIDKNATLLAVTANALYATDGKGSLWISPLSPKKPEWVKGKMVSNIISLSGNEANLYALSADGVIYKKEIKGKDHGWLKIAYRNNETIKEDIKHIAFLNDRIYGISSDNRLNLGEQRSDGNLTARALAISTGEQTIVIVNMDVCGLTADFTGMVKKRVVGEVSFTCPSSFY